MSKVLTMETLEFINANKTIEDSLKKSISYSEYKILIDKLVENKDTTGNEKSQEQTEFTALNQKRINRWDKTLNISEENKQTLSQYNKKTTWLVLTESWCGDAAHIVPVIHKVAQENENINLRLVLRDENDALMNHFLTHGGRAIPKLIALDENHQVINTFGPRPKLLTQIVEDYKAKFGKLTPEFKHELQVWYNKDKGQSTIEDLLELLEN